MIILRGMVWYTLTRLVLARLRLEKSGGRLPGSEDEVLVLKTSSSVPSAAAAGKKRALPIWGDTTASRFPVKKLPLPASSKPQPTAAGGLYKPSYTPPPTSGGTGEVEAVAVVKESKRNGATGIFTPSYAASPRAGTEKKTNNDRASSCERTKAGKGPRWEHDSRIRAD